MAVLEGWERDEKRDFLITEKTTMKIEDTAATQKQQNTVT
jgi:hypothetical protein